ncbi:MAG: RHS repeat-associated core domain-containing protein [Bacteroidota bacterium]|nr:RHS repeat-associated core domain-containing protein [Bacteroidota bacterium]
MLIQHYYFAFNSGNGLNQLKNTNSFEGVQEQFTYNKYSQPIQVLKSISGQNFITSFTYDNLSRLKQTTYPGGYSIINEYDQFGFVTKIKEVSTNKQLWQFSECNQNGQPTHELLNGNLSIVKSYTAGFPKSIILKNGSNNIFHMEYIFDIAKGNLSSRRASHIQPNILEEFEYDNMQRLTKVKVGNSLQLNSGFAPNGNIISKSNVSPDPYLYTGTPPHAVTGITNPINMPPSFTQTISYTPFQRVSNILQGLDEIQFLYSSDGYRAKTITKHNNIITEEIYFAPNFEKIITTINKEINYIYSPNGLLGVMLKQGTTETFYYTYQDYLGNILALVDENGNVAEEYNFDAWGKRRNPQNWSYAGVTSPSLLNRGFTGHEHLDKFGLVNMNARLYDPLLGRMLSPDNFVQAPENTQSFNRYSYAWNNPLKYTDPDGNLVFGLPLLFWGIAAFTGVGSAMIMTGHSPSQTFNVAATIAVTVATAGLTSGIAASGVLGNTSAIMFGSMVGSGTNYITSGGKSDLTVSFGAASFNFRNNELGYLGKDGNSTWQNVGYGLGALANVQDLVSLNFGENVNYNAMKDPIGHGSLTNEDLSINISKGFEEGPTSIGNGSAFTWGKSKPWGTSEDVFKMPIYNANKKILKWMTRNTRELDKDLLGIFNANYSLWGNTCTSQVARALWFSGVWGVNPLTVHPMSLYIQLNARQVGMVNSHFLLQNSK